MTLKEFVNKYKMTGKKFCAGSGISFPTYWSLMKGSHRPSQRTSEKIEQFTQGLITVKELRGCDDREEFTP
jgi:transcriptional regulator with XRE-family HTH domain